MKKLPSVGSLVRFVLPYIGRTYTWTPDGRASSRRVRDGTLAVLLSREHCFVAGLVVADDLANVYCTVLLDGKIVNAVKTDFEVVT